MTAKDRPQVTKKGHEHGNTGQSGGLKLMTEELWWLACRTPENIVINLPDVEDSSLIGYRRA